MDQKQLKPVTPRIDETTVFSASNAAAQKPRPDRANIHQQRLPRWYSALITMGWKSPIMMKADTPNMIPSKFITP